MQKKATQFDNEIQKYVSLNQYVSPKGVVIFGGSESHEISLGEIKDAFNLSERVYNRSFSGMTLDDASVLYDETVAALKPSAVLLQIGAADSSENFDEKFLALISHIKETSKGAKIYIVGYRDEAKSMLNDRLMKLADLAACEFVSIAASSEKPTRAKVETMNFLDNCGFVCPIKRRRSITDLTQLIFGASI
ncbi:MAG: SGNH/GDSL hydrolase family protein [Planctomycetia bacterium]|nr:SGNH/GDSL hydrolase family protein [Planctomycetia bacterium]